MVAPRSPTSSWVLNTKIDLIWAVFHLAQGLDQHGAADAVIHRFGNQAVAQVKHRPVEDRRVANFYRAICPAGSADIDVHLFEGMHFVRELGALAANHPAYAADEAHPAAVAGVRAYPANGGKAHEPILVNVGGHDPDFIHVSGKHEALTVRRFLPFAGDQVAQRIHAHIVRQALNFSLDQFSHLRFKARRPNQLYQFLNQVLSWFSC